MSRSKKAKGQSASQTSQYDRFRTSYFPLDALEVEVTQDESQEQLDIDNHTNMASSKDAAADPSESTPKKSFLDLPGEIRNRIYELHSEGDHARLHPPHIDSQVLVKYHIRQGTSALEAKQIRKDFARDDHRHLNFFTPNITRLNRQIRREYISEIFSHSTLTLHMCLENRVWDRFVNAVGEDVLSSLAGLEIRNMPDGLYSLYHRRYHGSLIVSISLRNIEDPVQYREPAHWGRLGYEPPWDLLDNQLFAVEGIQHWVLGVEPVDGKRRLSRTDVNMILQSAILREFEEEEEEYRKKKAELEEQRYGEWNALMRAYFWWQVAVLLLLDMILTGAWMLFFGLQWR